MKKKILCLLAFIILISLCVSSCYAATYTSTTGGTHALELTSGSATYSDITVTKTGDQSVHSDDYDWQGTNAAVHASGGGTLTITGSSTISSNATYGNAVFSYGGNLSGNNAGDGTTINISDATITTTSNNSGGIMATGGGIITASDLTITTSGGSSAAIRSDKGGGTITVSGGTYTTSGTGSPAIYSTAEIIGSDVTLKSNTAQVVVIEGGNSVTLTDSTLNANHNKLNGQDTTYQAILIYQSMSGDASNGTAAFKMTNGSIINTKGDIFHVTNTTCTITLAGVTITNNDSSGYFLRASSDSWGRSGSNGGKVTLNASGQTITGNILVDSVSTLTMNLSGSSAFKGAINTSGQTGTVSVTVNSGSTWTLTANSYVSSLTNNGTINTGSYTLYVNGTAYDGGNNDDDDDDNDDETTAPSITTTSLSSGTRGEAYSETLTASGTTPITWTRSSGTLPTGLSLSTSGVISGTPTRTGTFTFTVRASNSAGSDTASLSITIESSGSDSDSTAPSITTTSLSNATVNKAYSATLKASGTKPVRWTAEDLPDGMTITSSGILKGTPTEAGTYSITFTASNSAGEDETTIDLTVIDVKPVISVAVRPAIVGKEYTLSFRASSGTGEITWELSGTLPEGLEFDSDTATISGTPTEAGVTRMTITATNTGGTATRAFDLKVKAVKPSITARSLNPAVRGNEYKSDLGITGTSPVTVAVNGLPGGLEYNDDTGMITGTPERFGTFNVKIKAENSEGKAEKTLKLVVYSAPVIDAANMSEGTAGKYYSKKFTAEGTRTIYWSVSDGELPEGMYMSSYGFLRGRPMYDGTYNFTIQARNTYGTDTQEISLVVNAVAPIITGTVRRGIAGRYYSSVLTATGTSPITWEIDGDLPDGITFNEGIFSGTPTVSFNDSITVTASNNGGSVSRTYRFIIAAITPVIKTMKLLSGTQGEEYSMTLIATGTPDITWSWSNYPEGLELDSDTGEISGTPEEYGTFLVRITATNEARSVSKILRLVIAQSSNTSSAPSVNESPLDILAMNESEQESEQESERDSMNELITEAITESINAGKILTEEYEIISEFPEVKVNDSGMYSFEVSADESILSGKKLFWFAMPQNAEPSSDDEIAEFYDESGEEIETLPDNHKFTVSAWFNEGITYKPVIAVKHEED